MKKFSTSQIRLHWFTLILIMITYATMELRGWFPKDTNAYLVMKATHYNAGGLVWVLVFIRLGLKHKYKDPGIIPAPPYWQMRAAKLMHIVLYGTFLALPILGIALMAYGGKNWSFFGLPLWPFVTPNAGVKATLKEIHETLANAGYLFIALHAGAVLFHHFIQKDNTLLRMIFDKSTSD